jgi:GNAT superfamily N-acetyltransferase
VDRLSGSSMNKAPPRLSAAALGVALERNGHDVRVRRVAVIDVAGCIVALADLLVDCVEDGASLGFLPPLPRDRAVAFWTAVAIGVARGERVLLVAEDTGRRIVGTVQMIAALPDNQRHRADVAMLLVHPCARRNGIAQRLIAALDDAARAERKAVLVCDVVTGSDAARLCQRTGWQRVGNIPNYALMPGGRFCGTTYFYKHL